jgi:iron complex outermembrane receptor protein
MKNLYLFLFFYLSALTMVVAQNSLSGKVTGTGKDSASLEGALVYIPDLKVGGIVHAGGAYSINNLPAGSYTVETRLVGYGQQIVIVTIKGATTQDFKLSSAAINEEEVVVTGNSNALSKDRNPQPTSEIDKDYLNEHSATNVIDAIALAPGVSAMTDGQSISKPIIRGLGYNRVVTVSDGVVQEDQAWFDEFGIEVDPDAVDRAEILKGPASLAYGSDAIAGVVNLIPEVPLAEGQIKGEIMSNYQTNNGLVNNMFKIGGTNDGISWGARVDYILAHAYQNAFDGYVLNSQFNNFNADATLGIHRKWGYSQVHASYFDMATGIVDGTRDSLGNQLRQVAYPDLNGGAASYELPTNQDEKSYTPFVINQRIRHTKVVWDNSIAVGQGRITGIFSYQKNQRQETNDPTMPNTPDIYYSSNAATYDLRYVSQNWSGFDFSLGVNGAYQASQSLGTYILIPNYNLFQIGGFAIADYKYKGLTISGGIRYDYRMFHGGDSWIDSASQEPRMPNAPGAFHEFTAFNSNFGGVSGSIGATYNFKHDIYLKGNVASGFRAPNVAECAANGVHDGTVVWELGDPNLKPEQSIEEDLSFGMNGKDVSFELDLFNNNINNFIYAKGLSSVFGGDSINNSFAPIGPPLDSAPVYKYTQGNAQLYGGEAVLHIHPAIASWVELYSTLSVVRGGLLHVADSIKVLPFVPPTRITADLRFNLNNIVRGSKMDKVIKRTYIKIGFIYCFQQNQVYQQYAVYNGYTASSTPFEYAASKAATPGYFLLNLGAGGDILSRKGHTIVRLFVAVNNVANTTYMDYMSRFKYYPVNYATDRVGVFNMGRNVSIKLDIPLDFKRAD